MNTSVLEDKLNKIFMDTVNIDFKNKDEGFKNIKLFSKKIALNPRDLVYVFMRIQNEFQITVPEKILVDGKFSTYNEILKCIENAPRG